MANAFTNQGATPNALANLFQPPKPQTQTGMIQPVGGMNSSNASMVPQGQLPGLISPHPTATPSTPPKKVTTTDTAGNITSTEYHAPAAPPTYDNKTGFLTDYGKSIGAKAVQQGDPLYSAPQPKTSTTPTPQPQTPTYPGLITNLANQQNSPNNQIVSESAKGLQGLSGQNPATSGPAFDEYTKAVQAQQKLQSGIAQQYGNIESQAIPLEFQQGREQALARQYAGQLQAAQGAVQQQQAAIGQQIQGTQTQQAGLNQAGSLGIQGQQLGQSALTSAGQLAQPIQLPYSNQYINPLTGQPVGGGGGGTTGSLQDAVANVVQKLTSGQIGYNDAVSALSGYGQGGMNALQQALPPGFNIAQSNTLAGQQGSIGPAYQYAKTALTNLQNAVQGLGTGQNTNVPIINQITQGLSTTFGVGSQAVQAYKGALAEARSAIQKVLASVQGGTPTDYVGQSNALLPDNATPNQINAAQQTLDTLGQAKVNIYGNPGQSSGTSGGTTGGYAEAW